MGVSLYVCDGVVTVLTFCLRCWLELSRLVCVTCFSFTSEYSPHLELQPRLFSNAVIVVPLSTAVFGMHTLARELESKRDNRHVIVSTSMP